MTTSQWERLSRRVIDKQIDLGTIQISTADDGCVHVRSDDALLTFFDEEWQALVADVKHGRFELSTVS